jgi:general secretion pathway protein H
MRVRRRAKSVPSSRAAFTLLEILLTLALIGLLTSVLVVGALSLIDTKPITVEDVFWKAVGASRKVALISGHEVRMRFVAKDKTYALVSTGPEGEKRFPFEKQENLKVDFLSAQKSSSAILISSQLVETQTVPYVTFFGDGTCSPFRLQIRAGAGAARSLSIDPWTCAPVLPVTDTNRPL